MRGDNRLYELIDRWEALDDEGRAPTPEELCREAPDLLPELREWIRALKGTSWLDRSLDGHAAETHPKSDVVVQDGPAQRVLGDYLLLEKIGAGGMGQVFKARHQRMERTVAVKILPPAVSQNAAVVSRFHREVKAAARLEHPNIVTAYDAGEAEGTHFLVMQFVAGRDLASVAQTSGPLTVEQAIRVIVQAARGLAYAHGKGVVHRDIKPGNLLMDADGTVKILDMGLARLDESTDTHEGLTRDGQVMGTVDYMAPEQAFDTHCVDARADIYSLGCTLYRLLIGTPMYPGDTILQKLTAHQQKPIPSLCAARADLPHELDAVFQRMVAKRPEDRYQSMLEVIADLEGLNLVRSERSQVDNRAQGSEHVAAGRQRGGPWWYRRPRALNAALSVVVVLLAATIVWKLYTRSHAAPASHAAVAGAPGAPPAAVAPFNAVQARRHQEAWARYLGVPLEYKNSLGMRLMLIPPGEFMLGAPQAEVEELVKEGPSKRILAAIESQVPQHRVWLTRPFRLAESEVVVQQFRKFVSETGYKTDAERDGKGGHIRDEDGKPVQKPELNWSNPGHPQTPFCPVVQVTWNDSVEFCNWLSRSEGLPPVYVVDSEENWHVRPSPGYRLPTDAEWEFACRAGTTSAYFWGDSPDSTDAYAWNWNNADGATHPNRSKLPNPFGIYDIQGNAREWVADWFDKQYYANSPPVDPPGPESGTSRVLRGAGWCSMDPACRSAARGSSAQSYAHGNNGFRVARAVESPGQSAAVSPSSPPSASGYGFVLEFDGQKSYLVVPGWNYKGAHPLTLEAWVTPRSRHFQEVMADIEAAGIALAMRDSNWFFHVTDEQRRKCEVASDEPPKMNERTHLAAIFDGRVASLYVNGRKQKHTAPLAGKFLPSKKPFMIGAQPAGDKPDSFFQGTIDEVRISHVARYDTDFVPPQHLKPDAKTVALYHFDDGRGNVAHDESSNHHDAQVHSAIWLAPPPSSAP